MRPFDGAFLEKQETAKKLEHICLTSSYAADNFLLKVNSRNTRARCEICSKLTIKIPERRQWRCFVVFTANFEHISQFDLVFLLLTLST